MFQFVSSVFSNWLWSITKVLIISVQSTSHIITVHNTSSLTANETSLCMDTRQNCNLWAREGECEKKPDYMNYRCPMSCNKCGNEIWFIVKHSNKFYDPNNFKSIQLSWIYFLQQLIGINSQAISIKSITKNVIIFHLPFVSQNMSWISTFTFLQIPFTEKISS